MNILIVEDSCRWMRGSEILNDRSASESSENHSANDTTKHSINPCHHQKFCGELKFRILHYFRSSSVVTSVWKDFRETLVLYFFLFDRGHPVVLIIKLQVMCINFSHSTTIFLVYIMFIIYNIRATSFGFMS